MAVTDINVAINVFGEGDSSYLVINVYQSDSESIEYTFISASDESKTDQLLGALKVIEYSLSRLLSLLSDSKYLADESGEYFNFESLKVYREVLRGQQ